MPVDTTGKTTSRRQPRALTEEEQKDIEIKRLRGELSCAECRRLKLKCDKSVPCGSCVRRGCQSICPCGILSGGQGTRFILADTDQLHSKIAEMSQRIRQLEEALAILQASISSDRHPLLATDLLKIKFAAEAPAVSQPVDKESEEQGIDALGTLTFGDSGEVMYFGRSAGTETLLCAEDYESDSEEEQTDPELPRSLSADIVDLDSAEFPCGQPNPEKHARLRTLLPPLKQAIEMCEGYLAHGALFFRPIMRDELLGTFMQSIYANTLDDPHSLATLFFIFAVASLLDMKLPPFSAEAERFYHGGKAALGLRAIYDGPRVDTVRAVGMMATYHSLAGKKYSRDSAWCLMSIASKVAQSIGLHRDCARWNMDPGTVQQRRRLFWDVFAADVSHSLAMGRPPSIPLAYVDCEYPEDEESSLTDLGEIQPGFWQSKYIFNRDIWVGVAEATLSAKVPGYSRVLELDRRVRELSVPDSFKPYATRADGEELYHSTEASLRGFYGSQYRTVTMIYLHRSFFAQAILDFPSNPLRSPYATSFLTAYRSASVVIKATAYYFDRSHEMAMRAWFLLHHTFSAAVIAGTIVTLAPQSNVASSALLDLGLAVELFQRSANRSHRAKLASGVLIKLKDRAVLAYTQHSQVPSPTGVPSLGTDELAIFGGQKRVLALKPKHKRKSQTPRSPASQPSPTAMSLSVSSTSDEFSWLDELIAVNPATSSSQDLNMSFAGIPEDIYNMLYPSSSSSVMQPNIPMETEANPALLDPNLFSNPGYYGYGHSSGQGGAMVELGLTSESGMDDGWSSFIQQCGVTLGESPPTGASM